MSDEEDVDAAYHEARKDDPDEWGEPEPPKPRRRLASMISVRLSQREAMVVREAAERGGVSVSAFLRTAALQAALGGETTHHNLNRWSAPLPQAVTPELTLQAIPRGADSSSIGSTGLVQLTA